MTMYTPAPAVNPVSTGSLTKRVSAPTRASPATSWTAPIKNVSITTAVIGSPCAANSIAFAASMTEIAFVGPLIRNSELPMAAPRIEATTAVAIPTDGGKPAISA